MKERPIIFNAEMVRAILDGRKTQTRRVMKAQPEYPELGLRHIVDSTNSDDIGKYFWSQSDACGINKPRSKAFPCPFGQVGDRLWVRETFASGLCTETTLAYLATHKREDLEDGWNETIKWTPSIHMPRRASRILLEITAVRVERLNSISEEDAISEGIDADRLAESQDNYDCIADHNMTGRPTAKGYFSDLWQSIYGVDSWNANPWVWVIEFKRVGGSDASK